MIETCVNGRTQQYEQPMPVAELLVRMALAGKKVAIERNGAIVPRGEHALIM